MTVTAQRSPQDVLDDHLSTSLNGSAEEDLERNDAPDVVIVSNWGASSTGTTASVSWRVCCSPSCPGARSRTRHG